MIVTCPLTFNPTGDSKNIFPRADRLRFSVLKRTSVKNVIEE